MTTTPTHEDRWIVMVQGELDIATRDHLAGLAGMLPDCVDGVDFDLSGVTFIDLSGWDGVTTAIERLNDAGVPSRVVHESEAVRWLRRWLAAPRLVRAA